MKKYLLLLHEPSKRIILPLVLIMLAFCVNAQTEDFESETTNATMFTTGGFSFITTGDLFVEEFQNLGCNSDKWLGSGFNFGGGSVGSFGSFKLNNPGERFEVSTTSSWCAWTSNNDGNNFQSGDVKFVGTLVCGGTIEETINVDPPDDFTFDQITFSSAIWQNQELTELEAQIPSPTINYLALDNIVFESISSVNPAITCPPANPPTIEGCSSADITLSSGLSFSTVTVNITEAEYISEGGNIAPPGSVNSISYIDVSNGGPGNCPITVTRTFTFCPGTNTCVQNWVINDTTNPMINCPPTLNIEGCSTADITVSSGLPFSPMLNLLTSAQLTAEGGSWSDNCTPQLMIQYQDVVTPNSSCPIIVTRTFTVTDVCGNTAQCMQTINIDDTTDPMITCPGTQTRDVDANCNYLVEDFTGLANTSDNCGGVSVTQSPAAGMTFNGSGNTVIVLTATDGCGNTETCNMDLILQDVTPPMITTCPPDPANTIEGCDENDVFPTSQLPFSPLDSTITPSQFMAEGGMASDNCNLIISYVDAANGNCPVEVLRTFTVSDGINSVNCIQTFIIDDTTPPLLACPNDPPVINGCGPEDVFPTSIFPFSLIDVTVLPSQFTAEGGGFADNCSINLSYIDVATGSCPTIVTRTWTATDDCGNSVNCQQIFEIFDSTDPVASCNDITVNLDAVTGLYILQQSDFDAIAMGSSDNCILVDTTITPSIFDCDDLGTVPVTLTVFDGCGNQNSCTANVTVLDPGSFCCQLEVTCPTANDLGTFDCNTTVPSLPTTQAQAAAPPYNIVFGTNPCGTILIEASDDMMIMSCGTVNQTITRSVFIWDDLPGGTPGVFDAGTEESTSCTYTYTFVPDTQAPVLSSMPANTTVECDAVPGVPVITAMDNCINITPILFINEIHYDNTGTDVGEFLEIAGIAGIDLSDYELYAYENFDGQFDAQEQLSGIIPDEGNGFGAIAFTRTELPTGFFENGPADGIALVEIATGNVIKFISYEGTCTATNGPAAGMTSMDIGVDEPFNTPVGESLQLSGLNGCPCTDFTWNPPSPESPGLINAGQSFDIAACPSSNDVNVLFSEVRNPSGTCPQEFTIIRTWSATDPCDNNTTHTQTITVQDNTAPVFCNPPGDFTVNCVAPPAEDVVATDNCDFSPLTGPVWINEIHYDNTGGDVGEFIEIAGAAGTDLSGFELLAYDSDDMLDAQITLSGIIPDESCGFGAIAFFLGDLNSQYFENGPEEGRALLQTGVGVIDFISYEGVVNAVDGPAMGLSSMDIGVTEGSGTPVGQSLQLMRTPGVPPGFAWTGPADDSPGSLNEDQAGFLVGVLTEVDNTTPCDGGTITRTWNVEDACGNAAAPHVQVITVIPPAGPTIVCPADMTVQCEADIVVDAANATVTTDCGLGFATWVDQPHITGARDCDGTTYEYTYHVVDDCGRGATCIQTWTLQNAAPTISVPAGTTVECAADIQTDPSDATVTTSCGEVLDVTIYAPVLSGTADCSGTTYTYTYRVEDQCEREATADRIFTIQNAGPTIDAPANTTCECLGGITPNGANATVDVSCDLGYDVAVTGPVASGPQDCPGTTYTYTYTATDDCGRPASDNQTFTINNGPPVFLNAPENCLILNCEDEGWEYIIQAWLASVKATNSCGLPLTVLNNYNPNSQGVCINNGTTVVTWRATDNCGRQSVAQSMIIINDTEPPVFTTPAQDELDICNYNTPAEFAAWVAAHGNAVAVDGCDQNITNNQWSTIPNNPQFPNCMNAMGSTSMTVTFVVRDDCGNKTSTTATFTALMTGGDFVEQGDGEVEMENDLGFSLYQNQPNPFKSETAISFNLPENATATLTVYDVSGRVVKLVKGDYSAGYNQILINRSELIGAGMFYYELRTATDAAVKKMIILE